MCTSEMDQFHGLIKYYKSKSVFGATLIKTVQ